MLVSKLAPDFSGKAIGSDGNFVEITLSELRGSKVVLFFYPVDFSFVCPTELIAADKRLASFQERGATLIGISTDSQYSHWAWREMAVENGGIGRVGFPLIADVDKSIARAFDVLMNRDDDGHGGDIALRATFVIDEQGIVQHATVNNLPLGRNLDETLRILDTLNHHQLHGEFCPAGWRPGDAAISTDQGSAANYLDKHAQDL